MNISPEDYNLIKDKFNDNDKSINQLFVDNFIDKDKAYNLILDVGCGPGNLTKALASKVMHNKIIGIDSDLNMLSYAEKNHSNSSIEYLKQDITETWDQLIPTLKQLENKFDFIYCSFVMHFMVGADKGKVLANCAKLLANEGLLFISIRPFAYISERVSEEFKSNTNIESLSLGSQINFMNQLLIENGFKILKTVIETVTMEMDFKLFIWWFETHRMSDNQHFKCKDNTKYESLLDEFINYSFDAHLNPGSKQLNPKAWNEVKVNPIDKYPSIVHCPAMPLRFYCVKI